VVLRLSSCTRCAELVENVGLTMVYIVTKKQGKQARRRHSSPAKRHHRMQQSRYVDHAELDDLVRAVDRELTFGPSTITRRRAARILGVSLSTLERWRHIGKGPPIYDTALPDERIRVRYKRAEVVEYAKVLEKERQEPKKPRKPKKSTLKVVEKSAPPEILPPDPNMITAKVAAGIMGISGLEFSKRVREGSGPESEGVLINIDGYLTPVTFYFRDDVLLRADNPS